MTDASVGRGRERMGWKIWNLGDHGIDPVAIDRHTVQKMLQDYPSVQTAVQLAALGYDKEVIREEFRKRFKDLLAEK